MRLIRVVAGAALCFGLNVHAQDADSVQAAGDVAQQEVEPNNRVAQANTFDVSTVMRGAMVSHDTDYFRLNLKDADVHRDVGFRLTQDVRTDVCLYTADAKRIKCKRGFRPVFERLSLNGEYLLSISLANTIEDSVDYELHAGPSTPNQDGHELEPNDRTQDATRLGETRRATGTTAASDTDVYRFSIPGPRQRWRISVAGTNVGGLTLSTGGGTELQSRSAREQLQMDALYLPPGDYLLAVKGRGDTEPLPYTVVVEEMTPHVASESDDRYESEPNDVAGQAQRLTLWTPHAGKLGRGDTDMYRFFLPGAAQVRVRAEPPPDGRVAVNLDSDRPTSSEEDGADVLLERRLLPGDHLLRLRSRQPGTGPYRFVVELVDPLAVSSDALADVDVSLNGEIPTLGAYAALGQRVRLGLTVRNSGETRRELDVLAQSSAHGWQLRPDQRSVQVGPGEQRRVAVVLDVSPDARADMPVLISLGVRAKDGAVASTTRLVAADCGAPPVGARRMWPLPDALLGRANAAWSGLGATMVNESRHSAAAIDGIVMRSAGAWMSRPGEFTVDLAGDSALTVLGTVIHPLGTPKTTAQLRRFELHVSEDGQLFRRVLAGELTADAAAQPFVLDAPVKARFARLQVIDNVGDDGKSIAFGEWQVIVAESPAEILDEPINVADHAVGGHDVYSNPFTGANCCHETFSTSTPDGQFGSATDDGYEWVMGFRDNRAARIERIDWADQSGRGTSPRAIQSVRVFVSLDSPVGPWTPLADWALERSTADLASLPLGEPVWARFVRFVAAAPGDNVTPFTPRQVRIFETDVDEAYRSVVGEWGYGSSVGPYERQLPPASSSAAQTSDAGDSIESASPLRAGASRSGAVRVGEDEDWYELEVPSGLNQLRLQLANAAAIEYAWELFDARGIPVVVQTRQEDDLLEITALVAPGKYFFRLFELPRSIIFSWDTSGSVGKYYDVIDHTMQAFASGVRAGREEVNLIPFNDPQPETLLENWSGDSAHVSRAIVNSDRRFGSSNAESAMMLATDRLAAREGTRAVLLVTDAETDGLRSTGELWPA